MPDDPLIGYATDTLRFDALLGRGAMGAVYKGVQLGLDRTVAIKVVAPHLANDASYIERFSREARTLGKVAHVNIIACHDYGPVPGPDGASLFVMVLEFVDGWSLGTLVRNKKLFVRQALELHRQAAEGLAAAHQHGIVHRDIKPDNIMVTRQGAAKLADFGLAKTQDSAMLTQTGSILGSPAYMAPETCRGDEPTPASDLYSLGCSLFHVLTSVPPYTGSGALQVMHQHLTGPVPNLSALRPDLARIEPLLTRLLAKDPAKRPASAAALAKEMRAAIAAVPPDLHIGKIAGMASAPVASSIAQAATQVGDTRSAHETLATASLSPLADAATRANERGKTIAIIAGASVLALCVGLISASLLFSRPARAEEQPPADAKPAAALPAAKPAPDPAKPDPAQAALADLDQAIEGQRWDDATTALARADATPASGATAQRRETLRQRLAKHRAELQAKADPRPAAKPETAPALAPAKPGPADEALRRKLDQAEADIGRNELDEAHGILDVLTDLVAGTDLEARHHGLVQRLADADNRLADRLHQDLDRADQALGRGDTATAAGILQPMAVPERLAHLATWRTALIDRLAKAKDGHGEAAPAKPGPAAPRVVVLHEQDIFGNPVPRGSSEEPAEVPFSEQPMLRSRLEGERQALRLRLPNGPGGEDDAVLVVVNAGHHKRTLTAHAVGGEKHHVLKTIDLAADEWQAVAIPLGKEHDAEAVTITGEDRDGPFHLAAAALGRGGAPAFTDLHIAPGSLQALDAQALRGLMTTIGQGRAGLEQGEVRMVLPEAMAYGDKAAAEHFLKQGASGAHSGEPVVEWYSDAKGLMHSLELGPREHPQILLVGVHTGQPIDLRADRWVQLASLLAKRGTMPVLVLSHHGWKSPKSYDRVIADIHAAAPGLPIVDLRAVPEMLERSGVPCQGDPAVNWLQYGLSAGMLELRDRCEATRQSMPPPGQGPGPQSGPGPIGPGPGPRRPGG